MGRAGLEAVGEITVHVRLGMHLDVPFLRLEIIERSTSRHVRGLLAKRSNRDLALPILIAPA